MCQVPREEGVAGVDVKPNTKQKSIGPKEPNENLNKDWSQIPQYIKSCSLSVLVFIMGITMRGDWLLFLAFYQRAQQEDLDLPATLDNNNATSSETGQWLQARFSGLWPYYLVPATAVSYVFYFGIGGYLHLKYYVLQRDRPEEWKCQPNNWLSRKDEIHEILVGWFSLTLGSVLSSVLASWVMNGGYTTIYFQFAQYGWLWAILEFPIVFVVTDYITYWTHRIYHLPFLYKHFHKLHHTYKQPTAFSVTAIHPIEFLNIQSIYILPMFIFPIHAAPYCFYLIYIYYHGIIDHSGIAFKKLWFQPWQPDCIFHDNHHQYFHVNFGFNVELWDKIHGTFRQKDKIYREDIFYGAGKNISEATSEELEMDNLERLDENPLAYHNNKNKYI